MNTEIDQLNQDHNKQKKQSYESSSLIRIS